MKKDTFYVKLLGELEISYKGKSISEKSSKAKKIWNLLAYIVMHKNRLLLQTDLIDTIWTEDENINPKSSLKTSMYRIRAMLSELAVDNEEFINECGLSKPSKIMCENITTISKKQLKQRIGHMPVELKSEVDKAIKIQLAM